MTIVCLSDTHGHHDRAKVPDGDILIHAGDITENGDRYEVARFLDWLAALPHEHKVFIGGNHDFYLEERDDEFSEEVRGIPGITYLNDSGADIAGLRIWGSPVQPTHFDWAFNRHRGPVIKAHWDLIPRATEVLVTHGPPAGILDRSFSHQHQGCEDLRETVEHRLSRLRLHVFGHIHPSGGQTFELGGKIFVNASVSDERRYASICPVVVTL